jgi:hypothetical protein
LSDVDSLVAVVESEIAKLKGEMPDGTHASTP